MKKILLLLSIVAIVFVGCEKDEPAKKLDGCRPDTGWVLNADSTECICPEETHYEFPREDSNLNTVKSCREKGEYSYLIKIDEYNCFYEFDAWDLVGYARILPESPSAWTIDHPIANKISTLGLIQNATFKKHDDGRIEVSFKVGNVDARNCLDWSKRSECPLSIIGHAHGISNVDNTEMDVRIEWIDCNDVLLNVGNMHLWKE